MTRHFVPACVDAVDAVAPVWAEKYGGGDGGSGGDLVVAMASSSSALWDSFLAVVAVLFSLLVHLISLSIWLVYGQPRSK